MNGAEVVKKFLETGFQLDKESLDFFLQSPEMLNTFIEFLKQRSEKPTTVVKKHITEFLEQRNFQITPVKQFHLSDKTYNVADFAAATQNRYEKIRNLFLNRVDLPNTISVNKISERIKNLSLITLVTAINEALTVEDKTGRITLATVKDLEEKKLLIEGEVIGLFCENSEKGTVVRKIVFPDTTLRKEITKTAVKINCFFTAGESEVFKKHMKSNEQNIVFLLTNNQVKVSLSNKEEVFSDPCILNVNGVKIFLSRGNFLERFWENYGFSTARKMLNITRKRNLFLFPIFSDDGFLEDIPDIFVTGGEGAADEINYKGTAFLSLGNETGAPVAWKINLQTRENIKIDLR